MSRIVVCGGSVIGLSVAMMLADDGHDVAVLEADPKEPPPAPASAWQEWPRKGVAQFRQPHNLFTRARWVMDEELPGLTDRLVQAGCVWVDYLDSLPPTLTDSAARPGDDRLRFVTGRRPVIEAVLATTAQESNGVQVGRGVRVVGVDTGPQAMSGVPHVIGVRTSTGEQITADLVVDASGRRACSPTLLRHIGARPAEVVSQNRGFVYYTRFFTGPTRPRRIGPALVEQGSISLLTLDGDNDTWSVTVFGMATDKPLRALRDPGAFHRVVGACPLESHWLD